MRQGVAETEHADRSRSVAVASLALFTVVLAAGSLSWAAIADVRATFSDVERARAAVMRYDQVQSAVSEQAFAEAAYRRAPGPQTRQALVEALDDVPVALDAFRGTAPTDLAVARQLRVHNARYTDEARRLLQPAGPPAATGGDDRVAGPALTAMQQLTDAAIAGHRRAARSALQTQQDTLAQAGWSIPVSLLAGLAAIATCWTVMLRQHRRLHRRAALSAWEATHDALTGLANRVLAWRAMDADLAREQPDCALLLIDLDLFKQVNDTHGHAVGDAVLVATAERLRAAAGPDDVVARLGGDEFAVLVRPAHRGAALARTLREELRAPLDLDPSLRIDCAATVGLAVARPAQDRVDLLRSADMDMYAGKRARHPSALDRRRGARAPQPHEVLPRPREHHETGRTSRPEVS